MMVNRRCASPYHDGSRQHDGGHGRRGGIVKAFSSALLLPVLVTGTCAIGNATLLATPALAYYDLGTVSVSPGTGSVSLETGSSTSVSVYVDPWSADETVGCGMAECPQTCGDGCADANGQCTCAGPDYSTYYTECSAWSSDDSVASAYMSGDTLVISANSAGSATITISGSLREYGSGSAYVDVYVSDPAPAPEPEPTPTPTPDPSSGTTAPAQGTSTVTGTAGATDIGGATGGSTAITTVGVPEAATPSDSVSDALNEQTTQTDTGTIYTVENNSFLDMATELKKIVDTDGQVVVWTGTHSASPDYRWTFKGSDLTSRKNPHFDPNITISKLGTGDVANITVKATDSVTLDFAYSGVLPGVANLAVKVDGVYADGTTLALYSYDQRAQRFKVVKKGITVKDGYASFDLNHCSGTWVLSTDDMSKLSVDSLAAAAETEGPDGGTSTCAGAGSMSSGMSMGTDTGTSSMSSGMSM